MDVTLFADLDPARPLVVCDIDEVVLHYLDSFDAFLRANSHQLVAESFRLHGNVRRLDDGVPASTEEVDDFQDAFFSTQDIWQKPVDGAHAALTSLSRQADIVFLTAMPPRYRDVRSKLLTEHGFHWPMVASEDAKGPLVARLAEGRTGPLAFVDDIVTNHRSVADHAPHCLLVHLMANQAFRALAPDPGESVRQATDWPDAQSIIEAHFSRR